MDDWLDEPIVDPSVPERERRRLTGTADREPPRWIRWLFVACAAVTGVSGALFTVAASRTDGEAAGLSAIMVVAMTLVIIGMSRPGLGHRIPRPHPDRYVIPATLDDLALRLLARARQAIKDVSGSRVNRLGLLDSIANGVVLPDRLWEIASLLRTHTELRAEQAEALAEMMTPELAEVLAVQREALGRSVAAVEERVRELEAYAGQVRAADAALRAHELRNSDDRYRDLLARTDDAEAVPRLIDQADALTRTLRRTT